MRKIWNQYRLEIIALILALIGVFFLVENLDIRKMARRWAVELYRATLSGADQVVDYTGAYVRGMSLSDRIGIAMVAGASVFVLWRLRYHFLHSERWIARVCPACGGDIVRIHRSWWDRFWGRVLFLPVYRYRCRDRTCGWSGLRYGQSHRRHHHRTHEEPLSLEQREPGP